MTTHPETITYDKDKNELALIDQRKLPAKLEYAYPKNAAEVADLIKTLAVRGAPAIGIAAAYALAITANSHKNSTTENFVEKLESAYHTLKSSRPTAVNLFYALARIRKLWANANTESPPALAKKITDEALEIHEEDRLMCHNIGINGEPLIPKNATILTHCNAGALATGGSGTALAIIYQAVKVGKNIKVFANETRPLLQGARLTAWELAEAGIAVTVITDATAATLMRDKKIDAVITGADRIAANGDTANKIGTYSIATLAKAHKIPFYIAAPITTFDFDIPTGDQIPIEERDPAEVLLFCGKKISHEKARALNPAFDITPARLITAIITDRGIIKQPSAKSLKPLFDKADNY